MAPTRIAINGFGRIGRAVVRIGMNDPAIEFVGINDLFDGPTMAHLLKYDSIFGRAPWPVEVEEEALVVNGKRIPLSAEKDPTQLPWGKRETDIVFECTGKFVTKAAAAAHLTAGAKSVLISAPAKDADMTCCFGVNHTAWNPRETPIISNASCTTNCLAPIAKVLHDTFGIERGFMTTIHSYTNDQRLMDSPHKDLRRARAGALSQIPTTTGAARAVGLVLPALKGKLDGIAIRVPTPNVSCLDLVVHVAKPATGDEVNHAFRHAAEGPLKHVLRYCAEPLVSTDFLGDPHSSIVDALSTAANGSMVKVLAWYDNEYGFSCRMLDMAKYAGSTLR
ncbi:MAG: type I glyceraldehyde-3-phosphate dehydrogenase [Deltaproteobacteria bacterium]|nr:type I glyceraldehyde-3-phosphate dehydrogenase [Deltaproteobacteria bacterium]